MEGDELFFVDDDYTENQREMINNVFIRTNKSVQQSCCAQN